MVVIRLSLSAFASGQHKSSGRCRFQRWRRYNIPWRKLRAEGAAINQTIGIPSSVASTTHGAIRTSKTLPLSLLELQFDIINYNRIRWSCVQKWEGWNSTSRGGVMVEVIDFNSDGVVHNP
ncbi:unnamed protein product [Musa banksii]